MSGTRISDFIKLTPRQLEAKQFIGKGKWIFFGGARGGGKTWFALAMAVLVALQFSGIRIVIIRKSYPELQASFIQNLIAFYPDEIFGYKYSDKHTSASFENGSRIDFRSCDNERDARKIKGIEYQFMIIDEANEHDQTTIQKLSGSLRRSTARLSNFLPTLLMTGNPGGVSDIFFKTRFINPDQKVWDPSELKHNDRYVFVPAKVTDNPYIGDEYIDNLESLDEALKQAWLYGNWDTFEGQFFYEFNPDIHICESFEIPESWNRQFGIDLGFSQEHPTVVLWAAQDPDDGTVYIYREYEGHTNIEQYANDIHFYQTGELIGQMWADPSMWVSKTKDDYSSETPAFIFTRKGLPIMPANNNRINGWRILKQWLHWTSRKPPKLKIMETCPRLIQVLPALKYSSVGSRIEDLDTRQRYDDYADALRYLMVSGFGYPEDSPTVKTHNLENIHKAFIHERTANLREESRYIPFSEYDEEVVDVIEVSPLELYQRFARLN